MHKAAVTTNSLLQCFPCPITSNGINARISCSQKVLNVTIMLDFCLHVCSSKLCQLLSLYGVGDKWLNERIDEWVNEWIRSTGRMILTGENRNTRRKSAALPLYPAPIPQGQACDRKWASAASYPHLRNNIPRRVQQWGSSRSFNVQTH